MKKSSGGESPENGCEGQPRFHEVEWWVEEQQVKGGGFSVMSYRCRSRYLPAMFMKGIEENVFDQVFKIFLDRDLPSICGWLHLGSQLKHQKGKFNLKKSIKTTEYMIKKKVKKRFVQCGNWEEGQRVQ